MRPPSDIPRRPVRRRVPSGRGRSFLVIGIFLAFIFVTSLRGIAGVLNAAGNVAGLMPHPERASEAILGSEDGFAIIRSLVDSAARAANAPPAGVVVTAGAAGSR